MNIIDWLLDGDISIRYQVLRDLISTSKIELENIQKQISKEGWAKLLIELRNPETKMWGNGIYSPKFISTHYTLLELKNLCIDSSIIEYQESANLLLETMWKGKNKNLDLCVSAMILSLSSYAHIKSPKIDEIVDYILDHQFNDGGWNCCWPRGAVKSSLHTTMSVLECFRDYLDAGYTYRFNDIKKAISKANEWILRKKLFRSERTNEIIHPRMLVCSYPSRWKYDILRALDYFVSINFPYDNRMDDALNILIAKMDDKGYMPVEAYHPGKNHFKMEKSRQKSRWNTLRMLRVLKRYNIDKYNEILSFE